MLDARFSHLYFYQSLNRLQRGLSAIAEHLVCLCFRCITICYIAPVEDVFFRFGRLRYTAGRLLQLIVYHRFHVSLFIEINS